MKNKSTTIAGHLSAFVTIVIWGTTFISTKILLENFTPHEILFFRFIIGYAALLLIYHQPLKTRSFHEERLFIAAGLCGVTLYFLLENIALTYTLASNVGIIVTIAPFFTALLAHFLLKGERLQPQFFMGFIIAVLGILLIGFNGSFVLKLNPLGDILALLASVVWAVYSILMRKISQLGYHTIATTRRVFFYGLLFLLPALYFLKFNLDFERFTIVPDALNLLYLGLGASALCFVSWNWSIGILGAVKTSLYIYVVPIITIAASSLILRENITRVALIGAFLILLGLFISEKKSNPILGKEDICNKETPKKIEGFPILKK
ncbi:MAG: DMT family transporter [Peptococcaceae bacterium]|nr:DMT family transporter [Peptococcaceae bacterium]